MRDFDVKTQLSEKEYKAMMRTIEAKGLTQAGYFRQLILNDIVNSDSLVSRINAILERDETGQKQAENAPIKFERK